MNRKNYVKEVSIKVHLSYQSGLRRTFTQTPEQFTRWCERNNVLWVDKGLFLIEDRDGAGEGNIEEVPNLHIYREEKNSLQKGYDYLKKQFSRNGRARHPRLQQRDYNWMEQEYLWE